MKKIIILIVLLTLVALGGYYITRLSEAPAASPETQAYTDEALGLSFEAEEGYVVMEQNANGGNPNLIKTIILMQQEDYQSVMNGEREGGEGPPVITLQAFLNLSKLSERAWVEANPSWSHFPLIMGEITPTTVAEKPGIAYMADGLYASRNAIFANGDKIFLVSGGYLEQESELYRDFDSFLKSIKFQ